MKIYCYYCKKEFDMQDIIEIKKKLPGTDGRHEGDYFGICVCKECKETKNGKE